MIVNRHAKRDFGIACAAAVLLTSAFAVWIGLRIDGIEVSEAVDDFGEGAAALIAAVACAVAAVRHRGRMRLAWALLASGAAACFPHSLMLATLLRCRWWSPESPCSPGVTEAPRGRPSCSMARSSPARC